MLMLMLCVRLAGARLADIRPVNSRAAAQAGKSVLHLDPAGSYGSHWASHRLDSLLEWAESQQQSADAGAAGSAPAQNAPAAAGGGAHRSECCGFPQI